MFKTQDYNGLVFPQTGLDHSTLAAIFATLEIVTDADISVDTYLELQKHLNAVYDLAEDYHFAVMVGITTFGHPHLDPFLVKHWEEGVGILDSFIIRDGDAYIVENEDYTDRFDVENPHIHLVPNLVIRHGFDVVLKFG